MLDAEGVETVQTVQTDAPQPLRQEQDAGEGEDVGEVGADAAAGAPAMRPTSFATISGAMYASPMLPSAGNNIPGTAGNRSRTNSRP